MKTKLFSVFYDLTESIVQGIFLAVLLVCFVVRTVNISGDSMLPTLKNNDKIIVWELNYKPKSGDIVIIKRGKYLDTPLIKRIIATENQIIDINYFTDKVIINNEELHENYIREKNLWLQGDIDLPCKIPKDHVWVMGDNRNNSTDSRFTEVGLIPIKNIIGKAVYRISPFDNIGKIN
ncbi:MAG: signal peptidase I [Clostridia bacterium]|nr:signal peptidase I [Clostridia bacterium]